MIEKIALSVAISTGIVVSVMASAQLVVWLLTKPARIGFLFFVFVLSVFVYRVLP